MGCPPAGILSMRCKEGVLPSDVDSAVCAERGCARADRVFGILRENNPELTGEKRRTIMKPPQVRSMHACLCSCPDQELVHNSGCAAERARCQRCVCVAAPGGA